MYALYKHDREYFCDFVPAAAVRFVTSPFADDAPAAALLSVCTGWEGLGMCS